MAGKLLKLFCIFEHLHKKMLEKRGGITFEAWMVKGKNIYTREGNVAP